jgi:photosystem II stability/assembly factor-like uncharacterized protein
MSFARSGRLAGAVLVLACLCGAVIALSGRADAAAGELVAEPVQGTPAQTFIGASPAESPGEVWAFATSRGEIVRYTDAGSWEPLSRAVGPEGQPIADLAYMEGPVAGDVTSGGALVLAAAAGGLQLLVRRDPGGGLHSAPVPGPALLPEGEELFGPSPVLAAVDEPGGLAGAFVVPSRRAAVLGFDGTGWTREPVCSDGEPVAEEPPVEEPGGEGEAPPAEPVPGCVAPRPGFRILAIDASSPENAWLLGRGAVPGEGLELFAREGSGASAVWRQRSLGPEGTLGSLFAGAEASLPQAVTVSPREAGQPLTVTSAGVWIDAELSTGGTDYDATVYFDREAGRLTGSWCDVPEAADLCQFELGGELAAGPGRSFAWPPSEGSAFGTRAITGIGEGAFLSLEGNAFTRIPVGGAAGSSGGAALASPESGWLGAQPPLHLVKVGEAGAPTSLQSWPVPFRRPLTAVAAEPGKSIGGLGSEALAVGDAGQVARYVPGLGWEPEFLLSGSGKRATPRLEAVAWPEEGTAFAVGDEGAMWTWQKATGLWSQDPAAPPNLVRGSFTAIAFQPGEPNRGYAVGKQGLLLGYGREWTQEKLPDAIDPEANFTSVAFAGSEAMAAYKLPIIAGGNSQYTGGLLLDDGSGWRVDESLSPLLGSEEAPQQVAGLADGGAVVVTANGVVFERQAIGAPWERMPGSLAFPTAVAAVREAGTVRAIVASELLAEHSGSRSADWQTDREQVLNRPEEGAPPLLTDPYPLPEGGLVVRQTATGWSDLQMNTPPAPRPQGSGLYDWPVRPDPILALVVNPTGSEGWAVGGETGSGVESPAGAKAIQTAGVMRYGVSPPPPSNVTPASLDVEPGTTSFAIAGNAQCAGPCADLVGTGIGPERWLRAAVSRAATIPGLRGFLYTGAGVATAVGAEQEPPGLALSPEAYGREQIAYANRLGGAAGGLPTFAAAAASDLDRNGSTATHSAAFSGFSQPLGGAPPSAGVTPLSSTSGSQAYYSFESGSGGEAVDVIVLDYSKPVLGTAQQCWLAQQLAGAGARARPAIVIGSRDLAGLASDAAADAAEVLPILVGASAPLGCELDGAPPTGASAYFFDYPEENRQYTLSAAGRSLPAYGSGTLGYVEPDLAGNGQFLGASGFLLAAVVTAERNPTTDIAPVRVRLIPNVGELAMNAADGNLLRRSQPALFEGLARRPRAGARCHFQFSCASFDPDPYVPIPSRCQGSRCATGVLPEYSFTSSQPQIADFVSTDPASANPRSVLLRNEKPIRDSHSGLLCAFNAGTTTVTISTGGLSYSEKVTVLAGSAQRPCGTTPLGPVGETPVEQPAVPGAFPETPVAGGAPPGPPPPAPAPPAPTPPAHTPPPPPPPPPPPHAPNPAVPQPLPAAPFLTPAPQLTPIVPIVPPPPPATAQTTPPSGTSPVTQPAVSPEPEEEEEVAFDLVHHMAALQRRPLSASARLAADVGGRHDPRISPALIPALALVAALTLVGAGGAIRRRRTADQLAFETRHTRRHR